MPDSMHKDVTPTRALFRIHIRGSLEAVWKEITKTDEVIPCFFNMRMDVARFAPGEPLRMNTKSGKYTGVVGEILEWDPPRRFAHSFRFTQFDDAPCKVVYELVPRDGGVEFTLRIEELVPGTKSAKQMVQGATLILNTLKHTIETGRPSFWTRLLFGLFAVLEPLQPRRCLSSNWK